MKTPSHLKKLRPLSLLIFLLIISSCGSESEDGGFSKGYIIPETESFSATVRQNTQAISKGILTSLESYDTASGTYVFSKNANEIENLKPGTVVLFETHSLRKIKSVTSEGGKIIIQSEFARLTDYYKDAKISYSTPINWDNSTTATTKMTVGLPVATMVKSASVNMSGAQQGVSAEYKRELNGWKVNFKLTPEAGDKLKINLSAKKGNVCSIVTEGYISSFTSNMNIEINNSQTNAFSYSNDGIEGELEVKFSAVGLGSEIAILQIPAKIERTILVNGVIPVTLRLKANLKILPEVAVGSSSQVSMKLTYNTNTGFNFDGSKLNPIGTLTGDNPEQTGDNNTATMAIAGMGVGVEFPRFEIGIFNTLVVPYIVLDTNYSTYLSTGLAGGAPPCHLARLKTKANVGVTMSLFDVVSINNDYKLFEKEKKWTSEGSQCGD
ncbi:MAG: hypothetical protein ABJM06_09875 [Gilvibacter sp.]